MDRFWKYRIDHVIFWVATVCFHMYTRMSLLQKAGAVQFALEVVIRNGLLIALIYSNLFWLIPAFAKRKRVVTYVTLLAISVFIYVSVKTLHDVSVYGYADDLLGNYLHHAFYNFSIAIFYLAFSVGLELSREWYQQRDQIRKIEVEKLNTELEYLKAQINPHFLFNSINTIYFQIDKQNYLARDTLSAFSEMLRYQLYECNGGEIAVEKEVGYIRNYVDLQRLRKDENYSIRLNISQDVRGFSIAPLLLIPFVENAFKHVSHHSEGNEITIDLTYDGSFVFSVRNTCDSSAVRNSQGGIGLRNVCRRLQLLYNGRHQLKMTEDSGSFDVKLYIRINDQAP